MGEVSPEPPPEGEASIPAGEPALEVDRTD